MPLALMVGATVVSVVVTGWSRWWWTGAAFAGVGLAGALAGAVAVSMLMLGSVPSSHEPGYLTTTFGGPSVDWSDE
ncbi:hypothetical protein G3N64_05615 [Burkholderia sp. Ac-20344]|nr:hypothetical protein [Burkholderia sp. Ac-20344]